MLYKVLDANGCSCNGGDLQWSLPSRNADGTWTAGDWMPAVTGELIACENGYHLAEDVQVLMWLNARIFEAEYRERNEWPVYGDNGNFCGYELGPHRIDADDKVVVREARLVREFTAWNSRTARLFAVWCAREALRLDPNPDLRSVAACDVAERYARGEATTAELAAARAAARAAAWDAARAEAWAAAWAAARAAARDAARDAAWDAQYRHFIAVIDDQWA